MMFSKEHNKYTMIAGDALPCSWGEEHPPSAWGYCIPPASHTQRCSGAEARAEELCGAGVVHGPSKTNWAASTSDGQGDVRASP